MVISRNIKLLTWFNFFSAFKFYSAFAVIYFSKITHSVALGISLISITQIASAGFEIPTGFLSDRAGRRRVLIFGACARFVSLTFYASGRSFYFLLIGSVVEGLALALFSGNNEALLFDSTDQADSKNSFHRQLGSVKSMVYPALLAASLLGSVIATRSFALLFWLSLIPQACSIYVATRIVEPKLHTTETSTGRHFIATCKHLYQNTKLRKLTIAEVLTQSTEEVLFQLQLVFYSTLWPVWAVGFTRSIMSVGKFVSFRYGSRIIDRFTAIKTLLVSTLITRLVHICSIIFPSIISPASMTLTSFLWGNMDVSRTKLLQEEFRPHQRATSYSAISFLGSLFAGVLGITVGITSDKFGVIPTLLALQILFVPILYLYTKVSRE